MTGEEVKKYINQIAFSGAKEFLDELCSPYFVRELHEVYQTFFKKDRLIIGIGSGLGEHELLFFCLKKPNQVLLQQCHSD